MAESNGELSLTHLIHTTTDTLHDVGKILGELQFAVDFEFIGNASEPPFN